MSIDCVIIGYNDPPFDEYERLVRSYGADSEAYRDLRNSFVDVDGAPRTYVELLNDARQHAADGVSIPTLHSGSVPNLAAAYLTAFLRRAGFAAEYINLFQVERARLLRYLEQGPLCVAITTTFYVINAPVIEMVDFIRSHNRTTKIVVGGPLVANHARRFGAPNREVNPGTPGSRVSAELEAALGELGADVYVVEAQGEATLSRIVERLRRGASLEDVPNLIYADRGRHFRTAVEPEQNDMDDVAIDWFALSQQSLGRTIAMRTARSCAFHCAFCNYPGRAGKLSLASVDTIKRELDSIRRRGDVHNVVFIDDTFNVPLERFKRICRLMIDENYGFEWYSYFRCGNADREAFDLMARSGCRGVFLGIESGSPSVLKLMNKAASIEDYEKGIGELKARGILTFASFLVGFPGETDDTVRETSDFISRSAPDYYRAQLWYLEAGTPIDRRRAELAIEGDGFIWSHRTMDSLTASDHIERMFLSVRESTWLPQWSFDFWIIPYLVGEGIAPDRLRRFVRHANKLLALQMASVDDAQRRAGAERQIGELVRLFQ